MKCNVGKFDRYIRILVGLIIIATGVFFDSWWGAVGVIPLATGLAGRCLLYIPWGINTVEKKKNGNNSNERKTQTQEKKNEPEQQTGNR